MPSVEIPGKITTIEYDDGADYEIVTPTGWVGGTGNQSVTLLPTGKPRTVVILGSIPSFMSGGPSLDIDEDFNVGDIIEVYRIDIGTGVVVNDENGHSLEAAQTMGAGFILRKLKTGAFPTWGKI